MMVRAVVDEGLSKAAAARRFNTTSKTVAKWVARFESEGVEGLRDRSSRPLFSPSQATPAVCAAVEALRRQRHTGEQIAAEVGVSAATVSRVLRRLGLNRLSALEPAEPVRRYERTAPGELLHIDIKKLGKFNRIGHRITGDRTGQSNTRGIGWEYVHLVIDDHSRLAYSEIQPDEKRASCLRFLFNALRFFRSLGVAVERVMTDNGSSFRSHRYAKALRRLRIKHLRTKPYTHSRGGLLPKHYAVIEQIHLRPRDRGWVRRHSQLSGAASQERQCPRPGPTCSWPCSLLRSSLRRPADSPSLALSVAGRSRSDRKLRSALHPRPPALSC